MSLWHLMPFSNIRTIIFVDVNHIIWNETNNENNRNVSYQRNKKKQKYPIHTSKHSLLFKDISWGISKTCPTYDEQSLQVVRKQMIKSMAVNTNLYRKL